ncbi:MAG: monofunctional biosynthetic peptidoglycan transglycosylase [Bacteroidia bacterium]|nr:monofunctional biosynthetic peptidoglycan transglycosylase [Bacteroidia bacterium]
MIRLIFRILLKVFLWFVILSAGGVLWYRFVPVYITPLMIIRAVENATDGKPWKWKHEWKNLEDISENLQLAVVCSEDQNFLEHNGFDWEAMKKAFKKNKKGKRIIGGSTITQQTAKNVFLWPGRNYFRKALEAWFTLLIELLWPKERIMEVYLNSIEMGHNIYGAEAAAQYWFGKSCRKLSKDEAAAIASILPNPRVWKANPPSPYVMKRKLWIKKQMALWGNKINYDINEIDHDH